MEDSINIRELVGKLFVKADQICRAAREGKDTALLKREVDKYKSEVKTINEFLSQRQTESLKLKIDSMNEAIAKAERIKNADFLKDLMEKIGDPILEEDIKPMPQPLLTELMESLDDETMEQIKFNVFEEIIPTLMGGVKTKYDEGDVDGAKCVFGYVVKLALEDINPYRRKIWAARLKMLERYLDGEEVEINLSHTRWTELQSSKYNLLGGDMLTKAILEDKL